MEENKECKVEEKENCKCKKVKCIVSLLTVIFALTAMTFSILVNYKMNVLFKAININPYASQQQAQDDFVISEKYDKGQSFTKAKEENKPILTFFYVDWCGYCKRFAPTFDKLSKDKDIKNKFAIAYVHCESAENSDLVSEYKIEGFPTVFIVKGEEKIQVPNNILFDDIKELKKALLEKAE
ncbi:MAG: hypothetical protein E7Z91_07220 [Cyanobacteria bacterium SIG30]|nr:hypothetical protein [Cyanobacteria bacterium SIG30]